MRFISNTAKILAVDDEPFNLDLIEAILKKESFIVLRASDGKEAMEVIEKERPDLVFLDLLMPGYNGYYVLEKLKGNKELRLIPVVVLTAYPEEKLKAFEAGADDFISKPVDRVELLARTRAHLRMKSYINELEYAESVIYALAKMVEVRDIYTEEHTERVAKLSVEIGRELGLPDPELEDLKKGALLHDIGKIAVPDAVLLKPASLTPGEFEVMKEHTLIGFRICNSMNTLKRALEVIRHHHEKWDGSGYPDGLRGNTIPLKARIVSIADAFDAITSDRPYRRAFAREKAIEILTRGAGSVWDPEFVRILLKILEIY